MTEINANKTSFYSPIFNTILYTEQRKKHKWIYKLVTHRERC